MLPLKFHSTVVVDEQLKDTVSPTLTSISCGLTLSTSWSSHKNRCIVNYCMVFLGMHMSLLVHLTKR